MNDDESARIALHKHYSDQLMNHSRNLFAVAVSFFTGIIAYEHIPKQYHLVVNALNIQLPLKLWYVSLLIGLVSGVTLYFFGRIYFYGNLTRDVLAVRRDIGKGLRRINLGVSPEEWKNWFNRTALDEIDCAALKFFLLKARKKIRLRSREFQLPLIYLISGESYNTVAVVSTIFAGSFLVSWFYECLIGQLCLASLAIFSILFITSIFIWGLQIREVEKKYLPMLEKPK